jgi:catechol 2,3-dioxygenase-like lactoylglutathione lyase family enzyme
MAETQSTSRVKALGRVIVPVSNEDRAIEFYAQLGFEKIVDIPFGEDEYRWVEVALPGAETSIALVRPRPGDPVGVDTHIALDTDDIDGLHTELKDAGVDVDDEVSRMGGPVPPLCWLRDQDGNTLMLVEPTEG